MSVFDTVEKMKIDFYKNTGKEATDIYVGKNEMNTILHDVQRYGVSLIESKEVAAESLCGLSLHKTEDETHLGLGVAV